MSRESTTKTRILKAATALFALKGPAATSVDEIVEKAQCNKRMVYHYFGSKEQLHREVLYQAYQEVTRFEEKILPFATTSSTKEFIAKLIHEYLKFLSKHPHFIALLAWENLSGGKSIGHLPIQKIKNPILEALRHSLAKGKRSLSENQIRQVYLNLMAACYFPFSNRHTLKQVLGCDPLSPKETKTRRKHLIQYFTSALT